MAAAKVVVILVNWNNSRDTIACLQSLAASKYTPMEVIVVDNGSRPDALAALRGAPGPHTLIETGKNLGFTGGNNLGIREALGRGADLVFVLNNDTLVHPDAVGHLVAALQANPAAGLAAPKIRFHEPDNLLWYAGGTFSPMTQSARMEGYGQPDDGRWDLPKDVDFASGCAMLIRRGALDQLGGFREDYFAVWEDLDFSRQLHEAGYRMLYVPEALIWHKESAAVGGQDAPGYVYYQVRNRFLFLARWARSPMTRLTAYAFAGTYLAKRSLGLLLHGKLASIAAVLRGSVDGLAGRAGPAPARGSGLGTS